MSKTVTSSASTKASKGEATNSSSAPSQTYNGLDFKAALISSAKWLEKHLEAINALNVFPVPDGDTGTNMSRTMEAAVAEIAGVEDRSVEAVSKKLSFGALMGARGNSGVILSQIIRGLAEGFGGKVEITASELAFALSKSKEMAYKAVMKPVEGTILTVVRESAEAAERAAKEENNFMHVMTATVNAARDSVARTPTLLATLREAGVVDAGGYGYFILLEGALRYMRGESVEVAEQNEFEKAKPTFKPNDNDGAEEHRLDEFGYCTNFMLYAAAPVNFEQVRDNIAAMGNSAVIVGDSAMVKVHIHTEDPGKVISYATGLGALGQIKLDNMQFQHEEAFRHGTESGKTLLQQEADLYENDSGDAPVIAAKVSLVAVAPGEGLAQIFKAFGVDKVVSGGQTMNPSTQELLMAAESLPSDEVLILPNNKNIIMVAQQLQSLSEKRIGVVPSVTIPQGIMALQAFNYEGDLEENRQAMTAVLNSVATGEVTRGVRTATVNGVAVEAGQWIGLLDDQLSIAASSKEEVVWQLLEQMEASDRDLLTFYYGKDVSEVEAEALKARAQQLYPKQSVELVSGGQPHYDYIISAE